MAIKVPSHTLEEEEETKGDGHSKLSWHDLLIFSVDKWGDSRHVIKMRYSPTTDKCFHKRVTSQHSMTSDGAQYVFEGSFSHRFALIFWRRDIYIHHLFNHSEEAITGEFPRLGMGRWVQYIVAQNRQNGIWNGHDYFIIVGNRVILMQYDSRVKLEKRFQYTDLSDKLTTFVHPTHLINGIYIEYKDYIITFGGETHKNKCDSIWIFDWKTLEWNYSNVRLPLKCSTREGDYTQFNCALLGDGVTCVILAKSYLFTINLNDLIKRGFTEYISHELDELNETPVITPSGERSSGRRGSVEDTQIMFDKSISSPSLLKSPFDS